MAFFHGVGPKAGDTPGLQSLEDGEQRDLPPLDEDHHVFRSEDPGNQQGHGDPDRHQQEDHQVENRQTATGHQTRRTATCSSAPPRPTRDHEDRGEVVDGKLDGPQRDALHPHLPRRPRPELPPREGEESRQDQRGQEEKPPVHPICECAPDIHEELPQVSLATSLTTSTRHSTSTDVSAILRNQTWSAGSTPCGVGFCCSSVISCANPVGTSKLGAVIFRPESVFTRSQAPLLSPSRRQENCREASSALCPC